MATTTVNLNSKDFLIEVQKGNIAGHSIVHEFGQDNAVGTSFVPVSRGGIYQMPQVSGATTLRIKAGGNANDTVAGTGARTITLEGIGTDGLILTEVLNTNGASASSATTASFIRLYNISVTTSGSYATITQGSHFGTIVIENGAGGTDWGTIPMGAPSRSVSEIGLYTIPTNKTGYLLSSIGFSDSSKITELLFFKRTGILQTSVPYDTMKTLFEERVEGGEFSLSPKSPLFIGSGVDCGFLAKVDTGTAEVEVDFEILLVDD